MVLMSRNMIYYMTLLTPVLAMFKFALFMVGRLYISEYKYLKCNFYKDTFYVVDDNGLFYLALFAAQYILTAELLHIVLYEGGIEAGIFKNV